AGAVVGECGNSGHSTEPHLHFQFLDRPNVFLGLSLPIPFTGFLRRKEDGSLEATPLGFPIRGEEVAPSEQGLGR
ncbi:peptidase M23, partial [Thermus scotoductus]|uniref:M23 family metallopeptidase n=2 Tax=Thermus scotoductus TaxID=37636 RepID=UPI00100340EE